MTEDAFPCVLLGRQQRLTKVSLQFILAWCRILPGVGFSFSFSSFAERPNCGPTT